MQNASSSYFISACASLAFWNNSERNINREDQVLYVMYNTHPLSVRRELRFKEIIKCTVTISIDT